MSAVRDTVNTECGDLKEREREERRGRERERERGGGDGEREGGREREGWRERGRREGERERGRKGEREHGTMYYNHTMREVPVLIIYESYRPDALVRVIHKATTSLTAYV